MASPFFSFPWADRLRRILFLRTTAHLIGCDRSSASTVRSSVLVTPVVLPHGMHNFGNCSGPGGDPGLTFEQLA